jgi:hypothetical protein
MEFINGGLQQMASSSTDCWVVPQRKIFTVFDIGKWHKSEAYNQYLTFLRRINNAVIGIPTTSSHIVVSERAKTLIGILNTLEV